jgi:hypothetical protein
MMPHYPFVPKELREWFQGLSPQEKEKIVQKLSEVFDVLDGAFSEVVRALGRRSQAIKGL